MAKQLVIVGSGPVGLEMAVAALKEEGNVWNVTVLEKGEKTSQNVRDWGFVTLFSAWELNTSKNGLAVLAELGRPLPDASAFPTGSELVTQYLDGLAEWIAQHDRGQVRTLSKVVSIGRCGGCLKSSMGAKNRRVNQFNVMVSSSEEDEEYILADAVVDASGTYGNGNFSGTGGIPALGERKAERSGRILRNVPDPLGADRARFAQAKDIAVLGSGYSAITSLNALVTLSESLKAEGKQAPSITWLTRRTGQPYEIIEGDPLPQRSALAAKGNAWASAAAAGYTPASTPSVRRIGGVQLQAFAAADDDKLQLTMQLDKEGTEEKEEMKLVVDFLVSNCGFRPDSSLYQELQIHQCYASEGPMKLAAALLSAEGAGSADCLAQVAP